MLNALRPSARRDALVVQELYEEVLVFDTKTNKAHCLNQTASKIWRLCDGTNTVVDLKLLIEIETDSKVPEDLIWLAIEQLSQKDLLETRIPESFKLQNRREIVKKIGLAIVIALPLVASVTAPSAAMAVACSGIVTSCTGCGSGTVCRKKDTTTGMCAGGNCV